MRRLPIALAVLAHTIVDGSQNILPVVLPLLMDRLQLTYAQVGLAAALLNISSSVVQPGFGWLADRWATRWFMPVGIAWTGVLMGVVGWVPSYAVLLLVIFATGVGTAAFHPVASIAVAEASGMQRGLGMSLFSAGGNLGFAIGPIMATWLIGRFGLAGTLGVVLPCVAIACGILGAWHEFCGLPAVASGTSRGNGGEVPWRALGVLCGIITLRSWGYSGLVIFIPLWLRAEGMALPQAGWALFVFLLCGAIGGMMGGHLSDRLGRHPIVVGSLLAFPILMAAAVTSSGWMQFVAFGCAGVGLLASFSVTVVLAQEMLPRSMGLASGLSLGLAFGMGGVGVAVSGVIADWQGLGAAMWTLTCLPGIGGILAVWLASLWDDRV